MLNKNISYGPKNEIFGEKPLAINNINGFPLADKTETVQAFADRVVRPNFKGNRPK